MIRLRIQGQLETLPESTLETDGNAILVAAYRLETFRGKTPSIITQPIAPASAVELELDNGLKLWVRADELADEFAEASDRTGQMPGDDPHVITIPPYYPRRDVRTGSFRGVGGWALKMLRVFNVDPAGKTAVGLAEVVDKHAVAKPGLFRWKRDRSLEPVTDTDSLAGGPILLFLHGTASSTEISFGGLPTHKEIWSQLHDIYGNRVVALEHATFSASPVDNAISVLEALPKSADLHLVSHSRGGLIGELLCRGHLVDKEKLPRAAFTDDERPLFSKEQADRLSELSDLITIKEPSVRRFVRVACPARGTTLASERLDRWLSVLTNLIGLVPAFTGSLLYGAIRDFTLAVVKERLNASSVPGLEAMVPGSPFQRLINRADVAADADLSIIKGDFEGSGILGSLKALATDLFFREDHDLVVNTSAMDGGVPRTEGQARVCFDRGADVDHFSYFHNKLTANRVLSGLRRANGDSGGFSPLMQGEGERIITPPTGAVRAGTRRPVVFVLPGITGSALRVGEKTIWLNPFQLAGGGLKSLAMGQTVEPEGLLSRYYGNLIEHLSSTHTVIPFPYDWRLPIAEEAERFAKALKDCFEGTSEPVRIVAHSMGGLVARAALMLNDGLRKMFEAREECRLVMLGTPNHGSHSIPMMLLGRDQMMQMLAAIDVTMNARQHLGIVSRFPGVLDLLPDAPATPGGLDFFSPTAWSILQQTDRDAAGWVPPDNGALHRAAAFRKQLNSVPFDPARMFYIAGQNLTPEDVAVDQSARQVSFVRSPRGDGRVLWNTGIPKGLRVWYTPAAHGDLANYPPAFFAITDLLERGDTGRLPTSPSLSRDVAGPPPIEREAMEVFPEAADLAAAAAGGRIGPLESHDAAPAIVLRVVHGNLAFSRYPLMVGHYAGDTIAGAEAHIDRLLGGRLSYRRSLGLYPNAIATAEVLFDQASRERGAVVVGLGQVGKLTAGDLQRTLTHGLLRYAAAHRDLDSDGVVKPPRISALLVGAGTGGVSLTVAVNTLLQALQRAQAVLGRAGFVEVEIVELYENRAIQIWHEISRSLQTPGLSCRFDLNGDVQHGEGGRRRITEEDDPTWWQPMTVTMEDLGHNRPAMRFIIPTGMARAEAMVLPAQQDLIDRFINQAVATSLPDGGQGTPGRALFELLVPNLLKDQMREDRPLRLVLDGMSAYYPWELMDDRRPWQDDGAPMPDGLRKPLSVRTGMIRQLIRQSFRQRVARPAGGDKALVIGNPKAGANYPNLAGAREEAEAVANLLSHHGYSVTPLLDEASPERVLMALCAQDWKVVHIAAHGVVDDPEGRTGIVLGDGMVLTADTLRQMLPLTPELVFVNCCHLGAIPQDPQALKDAAPRLTKRHRLAANIAVELIDMGVGAVVAAGWAVNDTEARIFAEVFYSQLLDPMRAASLGTAVRKAREAIHDSQVGSTTWGAYQVYGEPDWKLYALDGGGNGANRAFASIVEAADAVDHIRQDAQTGIVRDVAKARASLQAIEKQAAEKGRTWMKDAALLTKLGGAYGELGDLEMAVAYYRKAVCCDPAHAPVTAIEQLVNLTARSAVKAFKAGQISAAEAAKRIKEMLALLKSLEGLIGNGHEPRRKHCRTVERWVLRGACHKRLAQIGTGDDRRAALSRMSGAYKQAYLLSEEQDRAGINPYPRLMHLTAEALGRWRSGASRELDAAMGDLLSEAEREASARDHRDPSFWHALLPADAMLLRHLTAADRFDESKRQGVRNGYLRAWRRGGSWLKLVSVFEQLDFIADVLSDGDPANAAEREAMRAAVILLKEELEGETRN